MMVIDTERSESGQQRRKANSGRLLHCCCICGKLDVWGHSWATYCSDLDLDESRPIPKFCGSDCRKAGGPAASFVTEEMKVRARDAEWRPPNLVYREATDREKYREAAYLQQRAKARGDGE